MALEKLEQDMETFIGLIKEHNEIMTNGLKVAEFEKGDHSSLWNPTAWFVDKELVSSWIPAIGNPGTAFEWGGMRYCANADMLLRMNGIVASIRASLSEVSGKDFNVTFYAVLKASNLIENMPQDLTKDFYPDMGEGAVQAEGDATENMGDGVPDLDSTH